MDPHFERDWTSETSKYQGVRGLLTQGSRSKWGAILQRLHQRLHAAPTGSATTALGAAAPPPSAAVQSFGRSSGGLEARETPTVTTRGSEEEEEEDEASVGEGCEAGRRRVVDELGLKREAGEVSGFRV